MNCSYGFLGARCIAAFMLEEKCLDWDVRYGKIHYTLNTSSESDSKRAVNADLHKHEIICRLYCVVICFSSEETNGDVN
jgi:hypothetical protein